MKFNGCRAVWGTLMADVSSRLQLTHKIIAIGLAGILGLCLIGAIYMIGASRRMALPERAGSAIGAYAGQQTIRIAAREPARGKGLPAHERHATCQPAARTRKDDRTRDRNPAQGSGSGGQDRVAKAADADYGRIPDYAMQFASVIEIRQRLGLEEKPVSKARCANPSTLSKPG